MEKSKQLRVAIRAARKAGKILMQHYGKLRVVHYKKKQEMVTSADRDAEQAVLSVIKKSFPQHSVYSEERGKKDRHSDYMWVIDPLDGTTNFVMDNPMFNTAIALLYRGEVIVGAVFNPYTKEMFYAEKGKGAYLNGNRIHVSDKEDLSHIITCFCHSSSTQKGIKRMLRIYSNFKLSNIRHVRQIGSAELELCYVAAGRVESFHVTDLNLYDVAAGALIGREAGGKVTDFSGQDWVIDCNDILASNGKVHSKLLKLINQK